MKPSAHLAALKRLSSRFVHRQLVRAGMTLTIATLVSGVLGYAYQVLVARLMPVTDYARFCSLMAVLGVCVSPLGAFAMALTRRVAVMRGGGTRIQLRALFTTAHLWAVLIGAMLIAFLAGSAQWNLQLVPALDAKVLAVAGLVACTNIVLLVTNSFLQGLLCFRAFSALGIMLVGGKILMSWLWIPAADSPAAAAMAAVAAASFLAWAAAAVVIHMALQTAPSKAAGFQMPPMSLGSLACANIAMTLMSQSDLLLVNYYLPSAVAAQYAAASIFAKATLAVPSSICMTLLPLVAANHAVNRSSASLARSAVAMTFFFGIATAIGMTVLGRSIVALFYGPQFRDAGHMLVWLGFAVMPISLVSVAEHFLIAKGRTVFTWIYLALLPLELCAIHFFHANVFAVAGIVALFHSVVALAGYWLIVPGSWRAATDPPPP